MLKFRAERVLAERGIKIKPRAVNRVEVKSDHTCKMREVRVNGGLIMMGNTWDFHPGCHGIDLDFRGADALAQCFIYYFKRHNLKHELIQKDYVYR